MHVRTNLNASLFPCSFQETVETTQIDIKHIYISLMVGNILAAYMRKIWPKPGGRDSQPTGKDDGQKSKYIWKLLGDINMFELDCNRSGNNKEDWQNDFAVCSLGRDYHVTKRQNPTTVIKLPINSSLQTLGLRYEMEQNLKTEENSEQRTQ